MRLWELSDERTRLRLRAPDLFAAVAKAAKWGRARNWTRVAIVEDAEAMRAKAIAAFKGMQ